MYSVHPAVQCGASNDARRKQQKQTKTISANEKKEKRKKLKKKPNWLRKPCSKIKSSFPVVMMLIPIVVDKVEVT